MHIVYTQRWCPSEATSWWWLGRTRGKKKIKREW